MTRQTIHVWAPGKGWLAAATLIFVCLGALLGGCASTEKKGPTYAEQILNRPLPATEAQKQQECSWLRGEMTRQRALGGSGTATQDLATLESRASQVGCSGVAQTGAPGGSTNFDTCYAKCRQQTNKANDTCFDLCTK